MGLVQSKQNSGTVASGGTLTVTLDSATTAGNGLIVAVNTTGSATNPSVGSITLGGAAGNFASRQTAGTTSTGGILDIWDDLNCAGGQTAVAITVTGGSGTLGVQATVWERDDLLTSGAFDKGSGNSGASGTSWTSNATVTTTAPNELFAGAVQVDAPTAKVITGPSPPWANSTQSDLLVAGTTHSWMTGTQTVSATQTATYSGTIDASTEWVAVVATFKLATGGPAVPSHVGGKQWRRRFRHRQRWLPIPDVAAAPATPPAVPPLGHPVMARQQPTQGGWVTRRSGVFAQSGPPARVWDGPVHAALPPAERRKGSAQTHKGVYGQTGPPARVWDGPVRATVPPPTRGGTVTSRDGVYAQAGPPVKVPKGPVKARQLPPAGGRVYGIARPVPAAAAPVAGPPRALSQPAGVRVIATRTGHVQTATGPPGIAGPPIRPPGGPVQARRRPGRGGQVTSRDGVYTFVATGSGPPVYPLGHPVQARRLPQRGGSTSSRDGTYGQTGPAVRALDGPVHATPPPSPRGRTQAHAGTYTFVATGSGPPVYPLGHPVRTRPQPPPRGRVVKAAGVYAQAGPPVRPLQGPIGLGRRQPPPPTRGRAASQRGPYAQTGPPVVRLRRPVRGQPGKPFLTGRADWRTGTWTAPFVAPFTIGTLTAATAPQATLSAADVPGGALASATATGPAAAYTAAYTATYAGAQSAPALTASSAPGAVLTASDARTGGPA